MRRKEIVLVLAIISLLILYVLSQPKEIIKNYPPKNNIIVAFGDSLIEGIGASSGNDLISVIEDNLSVKIINKGKSGDTTTSALQRLNEVSSLNPGIVILLLGGNDVLRRIPQKETFQNLELIIEKLQEERVLVVLLGVRGGILIDSYDDDFKDLSKKYQTVYVSDVLDNVISKKNLMYDGIHPNDKGYKVIADKIIPVLKEVLK